MTLAEIQRRRPRKVIPQRSEELPPVPTPWQTFEDVKAPAASKTNHASPTQAPESLADSAIGLQTDDGLVHKQGTSSKDTETGRLSERPDLAREATEFAQGTAEAQPTPDSNTAGAQTAPGSGATRVQTASDSGTTRVQTASDSGANRVQTTLKSDAKLATARV
jgi:hypothetical protein